MTKIPPPHQPFSEITWTARVTELQAEQDKLPDWVEVDEANPTRKVGLEFFANYDQAPTFMDECTLTELARMLRVTRHTLVAWLETGVIDLIPYQVDAFGARYHRLTVTVLFERLRDGQLRLPRARGDRAGDRDWLLEHPGEWMGWCEGKTKAKSTTRQLRQMGFETHWVRTHTRLTWRLMARAPSETATIPDDHEPCREPLSELGKYGDISDRLLDNKVSCGHVLAPLPSEHFPR